MFDPFNSPDFRREISDRGDPQLERPVVDQQSVILSEMKVRIAKLLKLGLMEQIANRLATVFETMLVHLCDANTQLFMDMSIVVIEYNENQQKAFKCRYGYASRLGNKLVPFG